MGSPISTLQAKALQQPLSPVYPSAASSVYPASGQASYEPSTARPLLLLSVAAVAIGIPVMIYRRPLVGKLASIFHRPVQLPHSPVFAAHGLQPYIATKRDLPGIVNLAGRSISEAPAYERENIIKSFASRTDEQLRQAFVMLTKRVPQLRNIDVDIAFPEFLKTVRDEKQLKRLLDSGASNLGANEPKGLESLFKSRFIDNPKASLVVLKDSQGNIVAMEGINQFQKTHDIQIDQGIFDAIDPKHALVTGLYVMPEYRGKGIGTALKKQIIQYGREHLGYQYVWAPTAKQNSSHRINQKLGYRPLTTKTTFTDSPAFTPELINALRREYNVGSRRLAWINTSQVAT